jgi:hypothetical protein
MIALDRFAAFTVAATIRIRNCLRLSSELWTIPAGEAFTTFLPTEIEILRVGGQECVEQKG